MITDPEKKPDQAQIEADVSAALEESAREAALEQVREQQNPNMAAAQAAERRAVEKARQAAREKAAARTHSSVTEFAESAQSPASKPAESTSLNPFEKLLTSVDAQLSKIKEKFWSMLFAVLPPSISQILTTLTGIKAPSSSLVGGPTSQIPEHLDSSSLLRGVKLAENPQFLARTEEIAKKIGCSAGDLLSIMWMESKLNPAAVNRQTRATGLIQFMPSTARSMGTTVEEIGQMSGLQQLDYVEKIYKSYFGKLHSFEDLYLAIFYPAALSRSMDFVLGSERSDEFARKVAAQNMGKPMGKEYITKADFYQWASTKKPSRFNDFGSTRMSESRAA